jgi:hypothetical protein
MWHYFEPEEQGWYRWRLNGAGVYLRRDGDAWKAAYRPVLFHEMEDGFGGPEPGAPPEGLPVSVIAGTGRRVALRPSFGDKPCLLKFPERLHLLPDGELRLALALPPALQLELADSLPLIRFMPFLLPETWYGEDTMSGSLYLSLPLSRRETRDAPAFIQGELLLKNSARAALDLDRLVLDTDLLGVYDQGGRLVCETLAMEALPGGDFKISRLGTPPGAERLSPEKKNGNGGTFIRRGVDLIRDITGK